MSIPSGKCSEGYCWNVTPGRIVMHHMAVAALSFILCSADYEPKQFLKYGRAPRCLGLIRHLQTP